MGTFLSKGREVPIALISKESRLGFPVPSRRNGATAQKAPHLPPLPDGGCGKAVSFEGGPGTPSFSYKKEYCAQNNRNIRWPEGDLPQYLGVAKDNLVVNTKGERFTNEEQTNFNGWLSGPDYYAIYSEAHIAAVVENSLRIASAYMMTVNLGA